MDLIVEGGGVSGKAVAPPSKSYTHRAVILASLADGQCTVIRPLFSDDTRATIEACRALGAQISETEGNLIIRGFSGMPLPGGKIIDAGNSGTTLRIMCGVASLSDMPITFIGDESLRKRPMKPLLDALGMLGVNVSSAEGRAPVCVKGPLMGGSCSIRGDVSSQFISSLLICAPFGREDVTINISEPILSKPYIELTRDIMYNFGAVVLPRDNCFYVPCKQTLHCQSYVVEGDYSSAAFILCAAAVTNSKLVVRGLFRESLQGDKRIVEILRMMGAQVNVSEDSVSVHGPERLKGIDIDMSDCPDLVPVVAAISALAEGDTCIHNVSQLKYKESDRLTAIQSGLSAMGASVALTSDGLRLSGSQKLTSADLYGWGDHRIVMALGVAALRAEGITRIDSAESIAISYPGFVSVMKSLGAKMKLAHR